MDGSDFQKNKKREKRGENLLFWISHSYEKKKKRKRSLPCFPISVRPAASTAFPNLALRVKSLPTPGLDTSILLCANATILRNRMGITSQYNYTKLSRE